MAYVGTVLFGTEREYADVTYEKTELGDADITYIDVSGDTPPLTYPEGYFQIANPVQYAMLQQQTSFERNESGRYSRLPDVHDRSSLRRRHFETQAAAAGPVPERFY